MGTTINNTQLPPQISHFCPQEIGLNITGPTICHGSVTIKPAGPSDTKQIEWPGAGAIVTLHYMKGESLIKNIVFLILIQRVPCISLNFRYVAPKNAQSIG
jgi:hypothetical protein